MTLFVGPSFIWLVQGYLLKLQGIDDKHLQGYAYTSIRDNIRQNIKLISKWPISLFILRNVPFFIIDQYCSYFLGMLQFKLSRK